MREKRGRERNREKVRQRVNHRFHDRSLFCRSDASSSEENGDSRGKGFRQEKFGRKSVTITRQTSGKSFWYRLVAELGRKKWSVILNEDHLSWLQGVLQTAAMNRWFFPPGCTKRVLGRVIHVGKTSGRQEELLQISEQTANGGVFKILIPGSGTKVGWAGLIKLLQDFYKTELQTRLCSTIDPDSLPPPPAPLQSSTFPGRSYADVVRGGGFYGAGCCRIKGSGTDRYIEVGEKGITERKELLGRSLIINFSSGGSEVFRSSYVAEFRTWATKYWAINDNFGFFESSEGNWLLICPNVSEALRIKELNHLPFKDFSISISPWMENISLRNSDDSWIMVFGIPLHIKSVDLLVAIGNYCGNFIEVDWNSWCLDFVRIRIRKVRMIPETVPLLVGSAVFTARVVVSPPASDYRQGLGMCESSFQFGKTNRPSSFFPTRNSLCSNAHLISSRNGGKTAIVSSSRDPIPFRRSPTRVWVRKSSPGELGRSSPSPNSSLVGELGRSPPSSNSSLVKTTSPLCFLPTSAPSLSPFPSPFLLSLLNNIICQPASSLSVWLTLDLRDSNRLRISFPVHAPLLIDILLPTSSPSTNLKPVLLPLPPSLPPKSQDPPPLPGQHRLITSFPDNLSMTTSPPSPPSSWSLSLLETPLSPTTFVPETPASPSSPSPRPSVFSDLPSPSCNSGGDEASWNLEQYPFDSDSLVKCTKDLSNLFELELKEGQGKLDDILKSVAASMHKRKTRTARSKLEMERRRLGPSSPPPLGPRRCKKASGVISTSSLA